MPTIIDNKVYEKDITLTTANTRDNTIQITNCSFKNLRIEGIQNVEIMNCNGDSIFAFGFVKLRMGADGKLEKFDSINLKPLVTNDFTPSVELSHIVANSINSESPNNLNFAIQNSESNILRIKNSQSITILKSKIRSVNVTDYLPTITINDCEISELLKGDGLNTEFKIENSNFDLIDINRAGSLQLLKTNTKKIQLSVSISGLILIDGNHEVVLANNIVNSIYAKGVFIKNCTLTRNQNAANLEDVSIDFLVIERTIANESIRFTETRINKELRIVDSVLDKAVFNKFDLENAKLYFQRSSIETAKYFSIKWMRTFDVELNDFKGTEEKLKSLWDLREAYRQLKVVSLGSHNKLDALKFQRREIKSHYNEVEINLFLKGQLNLLVDWIILSTNRIFSNFGESWILPLMWLLTFHFVFYYLFFMNDLGVVCSFSHIDGKVTQKAFGYFFNLLSPVHSQTVKNIFEKEISIYGSADVFMRISSGYFIYYFLRGTRKYNFSI